MGTYTMYWNPIRRVFLAWALIVLVGFFFTYMSLASGPSVVNLAWVVLALGGLVYSKTQMPFSEKAFRNIFLAWTVIIVAGIALSHSMYYWPPLLVYSQYLGAIWLGLMALGHAVTGLIDKKKLYILTTLLQIIAGVCIVLLLPAIPTLFALQYLLAGLVGAAAMALLILYA